MKTYHLHWSFPPGLCVPKDGREEIVWFWIVRHIAGSRAYIFWFNRGCFVWQALQTTMRCHKVMVQGLEKLLWTQYLSNRSNDVLFTALSEESLRILNDVLHSPTEDTLNTADGGLLTYIQGYQQYPTEVRNRNLGKTSQLWFSYTDAVCLVLSHTHAVKHSNFVLYVHSLHRLSLFTTVKGIT